MNIISIDVGTTNIKVARVNVLDDSIKIEKQTNVKVPVEKPERKAYEHNPYTLLNLLVKAVRHLANKEIDALAFTTYLFGILYLDKNMKPLSNIVTWLDERPTEILHILKPYAKELYQRTGCPVLHIYGLPKILWFKRYRKEIFNKTKYFLDAKSLLMYTFTKELVSDLSTVSGTYQLLNIRVLKWDDFALNLIGIEENQLPQTVEGTYVATMGREMSRQLGLSEGIPVITGVYDGGSMIYGLTLGKSGLGVVNMGTSAMLRVVTNFPVIDNPNLMRFQTYYLTGKKWVSGGGISNAGVVFEFLYKLFSVKQSKNEFFRSVFGGMEACLRERSKLLFIPILYAERLPFISATMGGTITGLTPETNYLEIFRAAAEGIVFLLKTIDDGLTENEVKYYEITAGGKIAQYPSMQKILANIFNKKIAYCGIPDISHLGNTLITIKSLKTHSSKEIHEIHRKIMSACIKTKPDPVLLKKYVNLYSHFKHILEKLYYVKTE